MMTQHPYLTFALACLGMVLAFVVLPVMLWRTGLIQAYLDYWKQASVATPPGATGVSAKRSVYIHCAFSAISMLGMVLAKSGWVFTKESLEAFNTFCYTFAGAYAIGKGLEYAGGKLAPKLSTPTTPPAQGEGAP